MTVQVAIREDPPGTVSWLGLLATNLTLTCLIPLSIVVARKLNRQPPGLLSSVQAGLRWRPLVWFAMAGIGVEFAMLGLIEAARIDHLGGSDGVAGGAAAVIAVTLLTSSL